MAKQLLNHIDSELEKSMKTYNIITKEEVRDSRQTNITATIPLFLLIIKAIISLLDICKPFSWLGFLSSVNGKIQGDVLQNSTM